MQTGQNRNHRQQAERTQAFLASVVESSPDAVIGVNPEGVILSWNHGAQDLYGYRAEEVLGKFNSILVPLERLEELAQLLAKARRAERISAWETVRQGKDGRRVDVALTISPVTDSEGEVIGSASIGRDISGRKRSEARYRAVIDTAREVIVLFDKDGTVRDFNPIAEETFGLSREQAIGRNLADFAIPARLAGVFRSHIEAAYREGRDPAKGTIEVVALRQNGVEFPFEISTVVI